MSEPKSTKITTSVGIIELEQLDLEVERNMDAVLKDKTPADKKTLLEHAASIHLAFLRSRNGLFISNNNEVTDISNKLKKAKEDVSKALKDLKNTVNLLNTFSAAASLATELTEI